MSCAMEDLFQQIPRHMEALSILQETVLKNPQPNPYTQLSQQKYNPVLNPIALPYK